MYRAEWFEGKVRHEVKGSSGDIRGEMIGAIEPLDLAQLVAWMRAAAVGETHGTMEANGWTVERIG